MASVAFEHVSKRFPDGTSAVVDCTLQIADGELMVFVGPSGCGKSTLLRMLAGLETVTSGTVRIGDQVVNDLPPQQRNVAMVFQDYALYPHMSVRRNLEFPLRMRGLERAEIQRRVDWAAEILAIAALLDRQPKQLSGGQRQRVAMGRALVREPTVFLLDEPLSNLDAKLRVQVRAEIGELQQRTGTTMIYVTHDQVEAMTLGHRVTVLDKGRLQQVAPPGELYAHPANVFVAGFIGNPPMNLFPTRVTADASGHLQLAIGAQRLPIDLAHLPAVRQHLDRPLTGGVRPEGLTRATNEAGAIAATVSHVEYLGHERLVYMRVADAALPDGGVPLTARLPGMEPLEKGAPIALHVDAAQVYLFDADGRSLGGTGT